METLDRKETAKCAAAPLRRKRSAIPKIAGYRNVDHLTPTERERIAADLAAKWEAKRAKAGRLTAAQALERARALLAAHPKCPDRTVETYCGQRHAAAAKRLLVPDAVSIAIGHRYTIPGVGSGMGWHYTFTAPTFEVCLINLRTHLRAYATGGGK